MPTVLCAGLLVADLFVPPLTHLPAAGELIATDGFLVDTGGCAANTATALARLGVRAGVAGVIGQDIFGDFVLRDLAGKGVDTRGIARSAKHGTSQTVILPVIGEDRRYVHTFGANADFMVDDIDLGALAEARALYVGGYLALPGLNPEALGALFQNVRADGQLTFLDVVTPAGDAAAAARAMAALAPVLPHVDYFLPNDEEAQRLTGQSNPREQAAVLLDSGCRTVVITQGARGVLAATARETIEQPALKVDVVDGSGAGDAFAAGLIAGLLDGYPLQRALRLGGAMGASACTALGCNAGLFDRAQAEACIA
jgi:sugar/nucleoside kinase (ribokinase family)